MLTILSQSQAAITCGLGIPFCKGTMGAGLDYRAFQCEKAMILGGCSIFFKFLRKIFMEDLI